MSMSFCAEAAEGATSNGARVPPKEQWRGLYAVPVEGIPKKEGESAVYRCIESSDNPVPVTMLPGSLKGYPDVRSPFDALYCAALAFPDDPFLGEREKLLLVVPAPGADREAAAGADARTLSSASGSGAAAPSPPGNAGDKPGTPGTGKDSASGFRSTRSGESLSDSCGRNVPDAVSFGDYKWITYKETLEKTQALAWALSNEVEVPVSAFGEDADVQEIFRFAGIWARSSAAWRITDFACNAAKLVSVPLYDTLGHEALLYILGLTKLQVLFVEGAKLHPALRLATEDKVPLRTVICFDPVTPEEVEEFSAAQIKLYYLDELIEKGSGKPHERPALGLEDVYTVIFTSGTTGVPKGVVHTNGGFVATIAGYVESNNRMNLARGDTTISYLPQSHVYQRGVEVILTHIGVRIGYYSGEITRLIEDLQRLKPTVFFGVPRVYTRILDRIMSGVKEKSGLVQWLFRKALSWKENNYKKDGSRFSATVPDVLFGKVRATFGGQLKTLCMGSAPMKAEALVTLQMLLAAPVCEGWGMTETGICFLQEAADNEKGTIGGPFPSLEFKIVSRPDLAYSADGEVPRGELLVRGPSIMKRYFQDTESTEAALDEDGWMRTGDVVELLPSGAPRIIDRAKNIFKLAQGEYISPERLENIFACSPFVEQIYLHGDSVQNSLVAVVVPSKDAVLEWAKEQKKDKMPYSDLLNDPDLRRTVVLSIKEAGRGRVHSFEEPKSVFLTPFAFTPDNGLASPTMKVVRKAVEKEYRKQIDELYAKLQGKTP